MEELLQIPLTISPPLMNAAGSLGFTPDFNLPLPWAQFGAFVTNPLSRRPRRPANGPRWQSYPGGALLHSGHPNPGFSKVLRQAAPQWAQSRVPVIVHLLASSPEDIHSMVLRLEELENILAVEIGFPEGITAAEAAAVLAAGLGELPLIAKVSLFQAALLAPALVEAGATAVSLAPPRGTLPGETGETTGGRMYGPGVFPLAMQAVQDLAALGVPVIGAGGVYTPPQAAAMQQQGALAVQIDTALWRGDWFVQTTAEAG